MQIEVLGAYGGESRDCRLTCLLLGDSLALDAGCLSRALPLERQPAVRSIVLSHSHMDHTNSLPFFIENVYAAIDGPIDIYAGSATIYAVRKHLFNNATWPDFTRLPNDLLPSVRFHELEEEVEVEIAGVRLTPFRVHHPVPTFGFLLRGSEGGGGTVLWSSDTGPTGRLWELANGTPDLAAVCLDTSFDNSLQEIADISQHLTPRTLEQELGKLERKVPVLLHHLKPPYLEPIREEVRRLANPDLDYLEQGRTYAFP